MWFSVYTLLLVLITVFMINVVLGIYFAIVVFDPKDFVNRGRVEVNNSHAFMNHERY